MKNLLLILTCLRDCCGLIWSPEVVVCVDPVVLPLVTPADVTPTGILPEPAARVPTERLEDDSFFWKFNIYYLKNYW